MYMISCTISCILTMISYTDIVYDIIAQTYDIIAQTLLGTPDMSEKSMIYHMI